MVLSMASKGWGHLTRSFGMERYWHYHRSLLIISMEPFTLSQLSIIHCHYGRGKILLFWLSHYLQWIFLFKCCFFSPLFQGPVWKYCPSLILAGSQIYDLACHRHGSWWCWRGSPWSSACPKDHSRESREYSKIPNIKSLVPRLRVSVIF